MHHPSTNKIPWYDLFTMIDEFNIANYVDDNTSLYMTMHFMAALENPAEKPEKYVKKKKQNMYKRLTFLWLSVTYFFLFLYF